MKIGKCDECAYWHRHNKLKDRPGFGLCQRRAPTIGPMFSAQFPEMAEWSGCGEWAEADFDDDGNRLDEGG